MFDNIHQLLDTLLKIEALHAGATTPGERDAAGAARDRIMERLRQFERDDAPIEQKFNLVNHWSMRLFCALAKRYDLQPYRYSRQRYSTVMLKCPEKFVNEVLWPEFVAIDAVLMKTLTEATDNLIAASIFKGPTDVEVREQPLIGSDVKSTPSPSSSPQSIVPEAATTSTAKPNATAKSAFVAPPVVAARPVLNPNKHVGRNDPCPCGSGRKFKKCCAGK